ncbi:hypothetical protein [Roseibium sp.]|uniref:hypothetical protein n=1 Tax=Roseibium sp. TaxID=1936156 RepID=UPI003B51E07C
MTASAAAHIPVLLTPTFKSFENLDGVLADVIEPENSAEAPAGEEDLRLANYERGLTEGDTRTRAHFEVLLEQEREVHAKQLEEERLRFEMREAANISAAIEGFLQITEQRLSYSLSKLLMPFLKQKVADQLVESFAGRLRQLSEVPGGTTIRLRGPETLVAQVLQQLPGMKDRIDVQTAGQVELQAVFDETTIETRLGDWLGQLDSLQAEGKD